MRVFPERMRTASSRLEARHVSPAVLLREVSVGGPQIVRLTATAVPFPGEHWQNPAQVS